jgi:hypothetical protein
VTAAAPGGHPALYQLNTRVCLHERSLALKRPATLDDIADALLDRLAAEGFDWVWLLGVWQTGEAGRQVSLTQREWQAEYRELLPDFTPADVCGSPFAVREYVVHRDFGGPPALERLRKRLVDRGLKLMLDFVGNHTALDHPWVRLHPEFYVGGGADDLAREPQNYRAIDTGHGPRILAHGRDPYFPGWPDTLQLDYRRKDLREALVQELQGIAAQCDGVRCDMARLLLSDVIRRTWGGSGVADSFWAGAIARVRERRPGFVFMAEAYWDLEWRLQQEGFDYTYDNRLYDRLRAQDAGAVYGHLLAAPAYQRASARFLENHDEPRAAAVFPGPVHRAAAVIAHLVPGLRFIHDGQREGRWLRTSNHLRRRLPEPVDREVEGFYTRLFACMQRPEARTGFWQLLERRPAWEGNPTWQSYIAFSWTAAGGRLLVAVNYGPAQGQCYLMLPWADLRQRRLLLVDLLNPAVTYERDGTDLAARGLYLDVPAWGHHVFALAEPAAARGPRA